MQSPPKRRKTSETTGVDVGASQTLESRNGGAPHPGRPSFQSPTRSSLARFHPDVLERALSRSPTRRPLSSGGQDDPLGQAEPKGFGLRDRKALRPSLSATASPLTRPRLSSDAPMLSPSRRASGIQSFAQPPRRVSKRIGPSDLSFGSPMGRQIRPTAEIHANTPEDQLASELENATVAVQMDMGLDGAGDFMGEDPLEPDLPPTPTQLGLEEAPDRHRGLWSSSPSVRRETRIKRRAADPLKGSPLKSFKFQRSSPGEDLSDEELAARQDGLSAAVIEKHKLRKSLATELRRLKSDVAELEKWARKAESGEGLEADAEGLDKFLALLTSEEASHISRPEPRQAPISISSLLSTLLPFSTKVPRPPRPTSPLPSNPFALQETSESLAYLTVFAPLSLKTRTSRTTSSKTASLSETHTLNFTAPSPCPANLYNVTVVYEANPETQSLTSVSVPTGGDSKKQRVPEVLRQWIDLRLTNPLLKLDVATLCWGINRYWEASVSRARLWAQIEQKYANAAPKRSSKTSSAHEAGTLTLSELRHLAPHLERSTMVINPKSSGSGPRVLLSYTLTIDDWTGEPQLEPEISVSAPSAGSDSSKKINQEAKKLFNALLREKDGPMPQGVEGGVHLDSILRATEGALGALFGNV